MFPTHPSSSSSSHPSHPGAPPHPQMHPSPMEETGGHHPGGGGGPSNPHRLRVTMPSVTQQSSLNTPLPPGSADTPTSTGLNWLLPSPDRAFYAPLFSILTPTCTPSGVFTDSSNTPTGFSSHTEFSFDPCISLDDPFRSSAGQQGSSSVSQQGTGQEGADKQQQQQQYHGGWGAQEFETQPSSSGQHDDSLIIPKQEPSFSEFCAGVSGPQEPSPSSSSSHQDMAAAAAAAAAVGLAEYNPSTSKGHEILSQVRRTFVCLFTTENVVF